MFEHSLLTTQLRAGSKTRALLVPIAFAVHASVLAGVAVAQYWAIGPVTEPPIQAIFRYQLPPPPPAAAAPPPASKPRRVEVEKPLDVVADVQPVDIPEEISSAPAESEDWGVLGGMPGGVPNGQPGGLPGGVPNGVPNGVRGGLPGGSPVADQVIDVAGEVVKPVAIERVQPVYTESARRARIQGTVIVETIVDSAGRVTPLRVLKSLPMGLSEAAVDAVSQWRFEPATLHGLPVSVYFTLTVRFEIK